MKQLGFPKGFLWGGATADFQYEGGFNEGGRGLLTCDYISDGNLHTTRVVTYKDQDGNVGKVSWKEDLPEGATPYLDENTYYPSHLAVDGYHHIHEDIELMAGMGLNVYRFSICWSRIFPTGLEETPNEEGLKYYEEKNFADILRVYSFDENNDGKIEKYELKYQLKIENLNYLLIPNLFSILIH